MISPNDSAPVKVAKGAALVLAGMTFAKLMGYAFRLVIARMGGIEDLGLLGLGIGTIAVAGGLSGLGLSIGVARFVPFYLGRDDPARVRGVLRYSITVSLIAGTAAGALLWLACPWIAETLLKNLKNPPLVQVLRLASACLPFYILGRVLVKAVVAFQRLGYRVTVDQVLMPSVRLAATIILVAAGMGVVGAMWAYLISEIVVCAVLWALLEIRVFSVFSARGERSRTLFEAGPFLAFSLPFFISGIIDLVMQYTDTFMTGYFLDETQLGLYVAAATLASLASLGNELLNPMFLSIITQSHGAGKTAQVIATFNNNNRWCQYITFPIVAVMGLMPVWAMALVWGESYSAGAAALVVLALGKMVFFLCYTSAFVLSMHGAARYLLITNVVSASLNVTLNLLLIPRLGITGAAIATGISLSLQGLLMAYAANLHHRGQGMRFLDWKILTASWLPMAVLGPGAAFLAPGWIQMAGIGILYLAAYLGLLRLLRAFSDQDRLIWQGILSRLRGYRNSKN